MIRDYFFLAFGNLRRRKTRSWLTMIGIFIGIAAIVSLISLGQGLQGYISGEFEKLGSDKIIVQSERIGHPGSSTNKALILTTKDLDTIKNIRGVKDAAGILVKSGPIKFKDEQIVGFTIGIDQAYSDVLGAGILEDYIVDGRSFKYDSDTRKVLVGNNYVYGDLWNKPVRIGNSVVIEEESFRVIGIMEKQGNPFDDNSVIVLKDDLKEVLDLAFEDEESQIIVKTDAGFDPEKVAEDIERKLRKSRNEKEGQETFVVSTSEQIAETFGNIFAIVQAVFVGIASIALVVGGVGIMNSMYTSVLERTREIGIMKAVGGRNKDILTIFLFEAGLLGLIGGAIGIAIGASIAKGVEYAAAITIGSPLLQAALPLWLIFGSLGFSFVIGAVSGLLPALQASKLKPVDALRYE